MTYAYIGAASAQVDLFDITTPDYLYTSRVDDRTCWNGEPAAGEPNQGREAETESPDRDCDPSRPW
jgi:hypothetical protein